MIRCTKCMGELGDGVCICPHCGYEQDSGALPLNALKRHTILHGRYYIGNVIGQGGFGITYVGWDLLLEMKVAVKEYFPSGSASRTNSYSNQIQWDSVETGEENLSEGMDRFLKEARKMAKLDSVPAIVRVRDAFGENGTAYIVMDFVEGDTLKKYLLSHGVLRYEECMKLFSPLLDSLAVIHDRGFIHRDISPDNIMLQSDGSARLLDMGAAVDMRTNDGHASMAVIKRNFSAPEQYMESESLGSWTDVYAMGATIYYCMTGKVVPEALEREFKKTPLYFDPALNIPAHMIEALNGALELHAEKRIRNMPELKARLMERGEAGNAQKDAGAGIRESVGPRPQEAAGPEMGEILRSGGQAESGPGFQDLPPTMPFMGNNDETKTMPYTAGQGQKKKEIAPARIQWPDESGKEKNTAPAAGLVEKRAAGNKRMHIYWGMAAGVLAIVIIFAFRSGNSADPVNLKETGTIKVETAVAEEQIDTIKLPSAYDYRKIGRAPELGDQDFQGVCWAFASLKALESSLLPGTPLELSVDHMVLHNSFSMSRNAGGEHTMSMAYLLAWQGPVLESEDPYGDGYSPDGLKPCLHVQDIQLLPAKDYEAIKRMVYQYGGVQSYLYTAIHNYQSESVYYNQETNSYCYIGDEQPNDYCVIIGWDDNYSRDNFNMDLEGDGAFICANSRGEDFGDQGYFYVSYYDTSIGVHNIVYTGVEPVDNYDRIYQSDLCGWRGQMGYGRDNAWFANAYTAGKGENLEAAGFYATDQNTDYEIYVARHLGETADQAFAQRVKA
ncbi:MAG: lectin like domain-containing protein, partial [Clostridium sp.]|nr:lectin like domain-containing protein [Clostridium sp.]